MKPISQISTLISDNSIAESLCSQNLALRTCLSNIFSLCSHPTPSAFHRIFFKENDRKKHKENGRKQNIIPVEMIFYPAEMIFLSSLCYVLDLFCSKYLPMVNSCFPLAIQQNAEKWVFVFSLFKNIT